MTQESTVISESENEVLDEQLKATRKVLEVIKEKIQRGIKIRTIYTHVSADIDNVCAVWAIKKYLGIKNANIILVDANWNGELAEDEIVIDIKAGGRGIKGGNSKGVGSAFSFIMEHLAPEDHQITLGDLIMYVELQDSFGSAVTQIAPKVDKPTKEYLTVLGFSGFIRALQSKCRDDIKVMSICSDVLNGMLMPAGPKRVKQGPVKKYANARQFWSALRKKGTRINTIYIPRVLTLETIFCVWAIQNFLNGKDARIRYVSDNWNEKILDSEIAINLSAGGKGVKGYDENGVGSTFACLIESCCEKEEHIFLKQPLSFVGLAAAFDHDPMISAVSQEDEDTQQFFASTGLQCIFEAYVRKHTRLVPDKGMQVDNHKVMKTFLEAIEGLYKVGKSRYEAIQEAPLVTERLFDGQIAIVRNAKRQGVNSIVFEGNDEHPPARIIVFQRGNNLGIIRNNNETVNVGAELIQHIVGMTGELGEWFHHESEFLYARGTNKAPAKTPSVVDPMDLAVGMITVLREHDEEVKRKKMMKQN